jgi:hypothetical protein
LDPRRKMSLLPCQHAGLIEQAAEGGGGGQACQIDGGGWWPGRAGELGTPQTAGERHHLVPDHSQAGGRHQTPGSSVFSASTTDTCHSTSLPSLWQHGLLRRKMNMSTTGGGHHVQGEGRRVSCSVDYSATQPQLSGSPSRMRRWQS